MSVAARISRLAARLPLRFLHAVGGLLGWSAYLVSPTYRRLFRANLSLAYPDFPGRLRRAAIAQAGRTIAELPYFWLHSDAEGRALVREVIGQRLIDSAIAEGRAVIYLTPHLGCFEIAGRYLARFGPITALYRPPKQAWLRDLVERGRVVENLDLARADLSGVRTLMRALKRREAIFMLPDQVPRRGEGVWVEFFGRPAYTMTLAARLVRASGAVLLLVCAERLPKGQGYRLKIQRPSELIEGTRQQEAAAINRMMEQLIRTCPEQYLWAYNRYKRPAGAPAPGSIAEG